ncbi:cell death abnormality 1-like isoform X1, partial [Paramuricea clavata]
MKIQLFYLALLVFGLSAAVEKPGSCPDVSKATFGACVIACGEDSHCKDFQKCCSTGCGQLCSDPACPSGVSKVKCPQALCRFSQCPNAPDALCRIDSCGQCNVEYYNKTTWKKITCTNDGQNLCKRMRDYGVKNPLPGRYTPTCTKEGKFESIQRMGSRVFCVDKETGIPDFTTETGIGQMGELDCKKKERTGCQLAKEAAMKLPAIGRFVPSCKADGSYEEKQCHGSTGFCWCVDKNGREWFGSRKRGQVDCPKDMCPAGVKNVQSCDPMICAIASCPGHQNGEVTCRINPCGQCKAEFLDKNHRRVHCQTCANKRAELLGKTDRPLIGQFVPECEVGGNYKEVQCWGSVGYCWCVDGTTGVKIDGTMTRGTPKCKKTTPLLLGFKRPDSDVPEPRRPVCPNGFPMMMCLRPFCQWSKGCAVNAEAKCRVNPCKMCAVEYFDENNKLIDCNQDMSECELKRADAFSSKYIGLQPVGRFTPQCEKDGNYSRIQCWASTGYCWCVDQKTGVEQEWTHVRGKPNCAIKTREKLFACPNGRPFLLCLHHCQLASCPAHPDAECNVDPCRMCKIEFKDSDGNVVNCSEKLTACELQKAQSPALLGSYTPQCEKDGSYSPMQCHSSTGYCWCVDQNGQEKDNTRKRGAVNCTEITTKKVLTKCEQMRLKARTPLLLGAKTPQCEADGSFKQVQSWEGYQWCVDDNGIELLGTRVGRGKPSPDCSKACNPVMCMIYCQHGFVKDSRGCKVCKCNSAPSKHGLCPKSPSTDLGCTKDLECPGTMKCCERKCSLPDIY